MTEKTKLISSRFAIGLGLLFASACTETSNFSKLPDKANESPIANDKFFTADFNQPVEFMIANSDISDPEDKPENLKVDMLSAESARNGRLESLGGKKFKYTPPTGFRGTDNVKYVVTDPQGANGQATLTFNVESAFRTSQPALAVRGAGCAMCHASVQGNVVTDFGYGGDGHGTDYFFGGNLNAGLPAFYGNMYGDSYNSWITALIQNASVFVPKNAIVASSISGLNFDFTLAEYIRQMLSFSPSGHVSSPPVVVEKDSLYIGAPTADEILSPAGAMPAGQIYKYIPHSGQSAALGGIRQVNAGNTRYMINDLGAPFVCEGDLVVDGVIFLKDINLQTNNNGCRIYATKTVFISGPINYLGNAPDRNLQISSARGIMMGLGAGPVEMKNASRDNSLVFRLQQFFSKDSFYTREAGSVTSKLDQIVEDSTLNSGLLDATLEANGRNISYDRLLLNSPNIQSRYNGNFSGVIVAEVFSPSFGEFHYTFAELFKRVPILPLIAEDKILRLGQ